MTRIVRSILILAGCLASVCAWAQAQREILIGHVAGYTGAVSKDSTEMGLGAQVAFDAANERGGFAGRKFRIVTADDQYKPEESVRLLRTMVGKVSALLPTTGSSNLTLVLKERVLDDVTLPVIGTIPSPESLRTPLHKNIFHFRAGDRDQLEKIVEQLTTIGITNIGVIAAKNAASTERVAIIEQALQKRNLKLVGQAFFESSTEANFEATAKQFDQVARQALVLIGPPKPMADLVKFLKTRGEPAQLISLSYADAQLIVKQAGPQLAHGVVLAQVLPNLNAAGVPLIKAFRRDFATYAKASGEPTYFHLEGYISARLIMEAMRVAKDTSPEGVKRGLERLSEFDLGGYVVDFSPTKHTGSRFVELGVISGAGRLNY